MIQKTPYQHVTQIDFNRNPEAFYKTIFDKRYELKSVLDVGSDNGVFNAGFWAAKSDLVNLTAACIGSSSNASVPPKFNLTVNTGDPQNLQNFFGYKSFDLVQSMEAPTLDNSTNVIAALTAMENIARYVVIITKTTSIPKAGTEAPTSLSTNTLIQRGYKVGRDNNREALLVAWKYMNQA